VQAEARLAVGPRNPAVAWRAKPRTGCGLSLPHLIGSEGALRQARVAEADLNFDHAVATNARTHGKRQATEGELEIRDLQPLRSDGDLAIGGEPRGLEIGPESDLRLGGGDDENGSLNAKHFANLSSMNVPRLRRRTWVQAEFSSNRRDLELRCACGPRTRRNDPDQTSRANLK
jgi:hypothetical protein